MKLPGKQRAHPGNSWSGHTRKSYDVTVAMSVVTWHESKVRRRSDAAVCRKIRFSEKRPLLFETDDASAAVCMRMQVMRSGRSEKWATTSCMSQDYRKHDNNALISDADSAFRYRPNAAPSYFLLVPSNVWPIECLCGGYGWHQPKHYQGPISHNDHLATSGNIAWYPLYPFGNEYHAILFPNGRWANLALAVHTSVMSAARARGDF